MGLRNSIHTLVLSIPTPRKFWLALVKPATGLINIIKPAPAGLFELAGAGSIKLAAAGLILCPRAAAGEGRDAKLGKFEMMEAARDVLENKPHLVELERDAWSEQAAKMAVAKTYWEQAYIQMQGHCELAQAESAGRGSSERENR